MKHPSQLSIFDPVVESATTKPSLADVEFDYGLGKVKENKVKDKPIHKAPAIEPTKQVIVPVVTKQEGIKDPDKKEVWEYILDCIDGEAYEKTFDTDYDKVIFLNDIFESEYWKNHTSYHRNDRKIGFQEWIPGLPSSFNVDYMNYMMLEKGVDWGCIPENYSEAQEEEFIDGWYPLLSKYFFMLVDEMKKGAPVSVQACQVLKNCKVDGLVVMLPPDQLERSLYVEVKNKIELIGGKWKGGKVGGFVFNEDPTEYLYQIANGESRNLKKEFQFFGTPDALADRLVELSEAKPDDQVLEPSAGQGAIVKALLRAGVKEVSGYELMGINRTFLSKIEGFRLLGNDFLQEVDEMFDVIVANPPFSKNQDIDHIYRMFECVRMGGRIVSVASTHWRHSSNSKEVKFRRWLQDLNATVIDVPSGMFSESGTDIATTIIVIDRPR